METRILYKKIADELIGKIERGDLRPGDRVPSEKQMAELYHVSVITTKNAMNTLADRGILVRERGRGTFIAAAEDIARIKEIQLPQTFLGALKLVGVIIPSMKTAIDQQLLDRIEYELSQRGYTIVLRITRESQQYESSAIRELISQNVRGLIIFPVENEI
jgi:DNA-binding transcriptional regulator YhcF (GntR family)